MPWFSYHGGHSGQFCRHAKGQLADVVARAADAGFSTYGLSEHCPRWRRMDMWPDEEDLDPTDLERMFNEYIAEATRLRDDYAGRLEVLVGLETEVVPPESWQEIMPDLRQSVAECDYIIGSVHHVRGKCIDLSPEATAVVMEEVGGREALEVEYFDLVAQVAEVLRPEVLGHLDLIRKFDGDSPRFTDRGRRAAERALEAARAVGSALDVNAAPHRRKMGPPYPMPWFLERACAIGVPVTLGDDSHGPQDVGVGLDACVAAIAAAGYDRIHYLTRRDGEITLASAPIAEIRPGR
jgi:histidinol-phosphatase (PHP family)